MVQYYYAKSKCVCVCVMGGGGGVTYVDGYQTRGQFLWNEMH